MRISFLSRSNACLIVEGKNKMFFGLLFKLGSVTRKSFIIFLPAVKTSEILSLGVRKNEQVLSHLCLLVLKRFSQIN